MRLPSVWVLIALILALSSSARCDDAAEAASADAIATLDRAVAAALDAEQKAREAVAGQRVELQRLAQELRQLQREKKQAETQLPELEKQLPARQEAFDKVNAPREAARQALAAAEKRLEEVTAQADATAEQKAEAEQAVTKERETLEAAEKAAAEPEAELKKLQESIAAARKSIADADAGITRLTAEQAESEMLLAKLEQELADAAANRLTAEKHVQSALQQQGRWVSFVAEVAPILQDRCLACHNARSAKGRLNLETYSSLQKGGESGPSVIAGNVEESLLCILIEDG